MIEFQMITSPKERRFVEQIEAALNDGWVLHSGLFINQTGVPVQALTRDVKGSVPKAKGKVAVVEVREVVKMKLGEGVAEVSK